jgi:hypothetical protein
MSAIHVLCSITPRQLVQDLSGINPDYEPQKVHRSTNPKRGLQAYLFLGSVGVEHLQEQHFSYFVLTAQALPR